MHKSRLKVLTETNSRLPPNVTDAFVTDLQNVLSEDGSTRARYLKSLWLSKFADPDPGLSQLRRDAAIKKWLVVEEKNRTVNCRLRDPSTRWGHANVQLWDVPMILETARRMILDAVGHTPSLDVAYAAYSGGASTSKRRSEGHPALKFLGKADSTRLCWSTFRDLLRGTQYGNYIDSGLEPRAVAGSILFTVPKNSEIDRVACKEPDLNVYFQKMLGNQLRYLLRRKGLNLNDQTINGDYAKEGSITGELATLDLSSASDSVTTALVEILLPPDWFYWMNAARSHQIDIDGTRHVLEMFSSMGNGFTFELESLIFWALARACARTYGIRGVISVYGDDIVCPTALVEYLVPVLEAIGFKTNTDKSFYKGPFRESCGAYWHEGEDVKPFFLRKPLLRLTDLIKVLNQLVSWSSKTLGVMDPVYEVVWLKYRALVPDSLWGGQDLESIEALVTGDRPRRKLKPLRDTLKLKHLGGYLHWLQTTALRLNDVAVSVEGTRDTGLYRLSRNRQQWTDLPLFLSRYGLGMDNSGSEVTITKVIAG